MEAPLAIRAWTLSYSRDKALAEPEDKNRRQSSAPLFYIPAYTFFARTIARYRTGVQLSANSLLSQPALAGNIRLIFQ